MAHDKEEKDFKCIAVMGGTFDPVHYGHLVAAEAVSHEFSVEYVMFMPTGKPPHKPGHFVSHAEHRYLMAVLATVGNPRFMVSRLEIERSGETYTIDTINALRKIYGKDVKIYFITGADAVNQILTWKDAEELLKSCDFVAVTRPSHNKDRLYEQVNAIKDKYQSKIHFLEVPALAISSSDIREKVRTGKPVKYLLPEEVEKYIEKFGLYKKDGKIKKYYGYTADEINDKLKAALTEKRYTHTQGVASEAVKLATFYGAGKDAAYIAGLLHDIAKCQSNAELKKQCKIYNIPVDAVMRKNPELLHCLVGAEIAKHKFGVTDKNILNAIRYHTTGRKKMSLLEKIIYIADFIEPNRAPFPGLDEIREMAYTDIDKALIFALCETIKYNKGRKADIHPWSIQALEFLDNKNQEGKLFE